VRLWARRQGVWSVALIPVGFGASVAQIKLPTRKGLLFKIWVGCIQNVGGIINHMLGLNKDIQLGTTNVAMVLHDIRLAATQLTEAFLGKDSMGVALWNMFWNLANRFMQICLDHNLKIDRVYQNGNSNRKITNNFRTHFA